MRARFGRWSLVAAAAMVLSVLGTGTAVARDPYAGAATWTVRATATTCTRTYENWSGKLPSGQRVVTVRDVRGTFSCYKDPETGTLRGTDSDGKAHVWYCSARDVALADGTHVFRLICHEKNVTGKYAIDLRGGNIGDVRAPSGTAGWTGHATYAMAG